MKQLFLLFITAILLFGCKKEKDNINKLQNVITKARPQPCIQVAELQETGKTAKLRFRSCY